MEQCGQVLNLSSNTPNQLEAQHASDNQIQLLAFTSGSAYEPGETRLKLTGEGVTMRSSGALKPFDSERIWERQITVGMIIFVCFFLLKTNFQF